MKRLLIAPLATIISASGVLGIASNASAGTYSPRVNRREANQQNRINNGISSGVLTPKETYRLQRQHGLTALLQLKLADCWSIWCGSTQSLDR